MLPKKISEIIDNNIKIISKKINYQKDFFGLAPCPFIGRYNYPNINVGIMSTPDISYVSNKALLNNPKLWSEKYTQVKDIVNIRSSLINSRQQSHIKSIKKNLNEVITEIGLAKECAETEIKLKDKPFFKMNGYSLEIPHGPNAQLLNAKITSNTKTNIFIEKAYYDTDLNSSTALFELYDHKVTETNISKILSVGGLGLKNNRKLVPTRWSITATDDSIGKKLIEEIKMYEPLDCYKIYFGGILGNFYLIIFFPEVWNYELFEYALDSKDSFSTDYENYYGRKTYSNNCEGGYYTVRLAILETLRKLKKQATVIAFRFITPEYSAPLGVWVTRESARKALNKKPLEFNSKSKTLDLSKRIVNDEFNFDLNIFLNKSVILKKINHQKKIFDF